MLVNKIKFVSNFSLSSCKICRIFKAYNLISVWGKTWYGANSMLCYCTMALIIAQINACYMADEEDLKCFSSDGVGDQNA